MQHHPLDAAINLESLTRARYSWPGYRSRGIPCAIYLPLGERAMSAALTLDIGRPHAVPAPQRPARLPRARAGKSGGR